MARLRSGLLRSCDCDHGSGRPWMRPTLTSTLLDPLFELMNSGATRILSYTTLLLENHHPLASLRTGRLSRSFISCLATLRASSNATSVDNSSPGPGKLTRRLGVCHSGRTPLVDSPFARTGQFVRLTVRVEDWACFDISPPATARVHNSLKSASSATHSFRQLSETNAALDGMLLSLDEHQIIASSVRCDPKSTDELYSGLDPVSYS